MRLRRKSLDCSSSLATSAFPRERGERERGACLCSRLGVPGCALLRVSRTSRARHWCRKKEKEREKEATVLCERASERLSLSLSSFIFVFASLDSVDLSHPSLLIAPADSAPSFPFRIATHTSSASRKTSLPLSRTDEIKQPQGANPIAFRLFSLPLFFLRSTSSLSVSLPSLSLSLSHALSL